MAKVTLTYPPEQRGDINRQVAQLRAYLFMMSEQLNVALNSLDDEKSTGRASGQTSAGTAASNRSAATASDDGSAGDIYSTLRDLIIKTANEVNQTMRGLDSLTRDYGTRLSEVESRYVASSEFGKYREETKSAIEQTSKNLELLMSWQKDLDLGTWQAETDAALDALEKYRVNSESYIRAGTLGERAGSPIIGIEIGQTAKTTVDGQETDSFRRFARFTTEKLSFYDNNGSEVAYLSNNRLVVRNADIKDELRINGYLADTKSGLALKWVGTFTDI